MASSVKIQRKPQFNPPAKRKRMNSYDIIKDNDEKNTYNDKRNGSLQPRNNGQGIEKSNRNNKLSDGFNIVKNMTLQAK